MTSLTCSDTQHRPHPHGRGHAMTAPTCIVTQLRPRPHGQSHATAAPTRISTQHRPRPHDRGHAMTSLTCIVTQLRPRPHGQSHATAAPTRIGTQRRPRPHDRGHATTSLTCSVTQNCPHFTAEEPAEAASSRPPPRTGFTVPLALTAMRCHPVGQDEVTIMPNPASNPAGCHGRAPSPSEKLDRPSVTRQSQRGHRMARMTREIGKAGWGWTAFVQRHQRHLLLSGSLDYPDRLQDQNRRARHSTEAALHPDLRQLRQRVLPRQHYRGRLSGNQLSTVFLQLHLHRRHLRPPRPDHRHLGGLRLLSSSAQRQRHLSLHHPYHAHAAADRRHHPDLSDVQDHRPCRLLLGHHSPLHRLQHPVLRLAGEKLLRRAQHRGRGRCPHGGRHTKAGCSSACASRKSWPASPPPSCSA